MRFDRLTFQGLGPFSKKVDLDLAALPGPLVAVTGENGAGKTVLLELLLGAIFRKTPTRGTLASLATTRESFVELSAVNGQAFTIRQTVDAVSGKGEALLLDADGEPLIKSGKRRDFDRWVADNLPRAEVLTSSIFGSQRSLGFVDLDDGPRKGVLIRVLGHEGLEAQAKLAGERARETKGQLETCAARLSDQLERTGDVAERAGDLLDTNAASAQADEQLTAAELKRDELLVAWDKHRTAVAAWQRHVDQTAELDRRGTTELERLNGIEVKLGNNRAAIEDADKIRAAAARRDELRAQHDELAARLVAAEQQLAFERKRRDQLEVATRTHETAAEAADQRAIAASARGAELRAKLAEADQLPAAKTEAAASKTSRQELDAKLVKGRADQLTGQDDRIHALRGGLETIADADAMVDAAGLQRLARRSLDTDSERERELAELPAAVAALELEQDTARQTAQQAAQRVVELEGLSAQAGQLDGFSADEKRAKGERKQARGSLTTVSKTQAINVEVTAKAEAEHIAAGEELETVKAELVTVAQLAVLAPALDQAEARIAELEPLANAAHATIGEIAVERTELGAAPARPELPPDQQPAEAHARECRAAAQAAAQNAARAHDRHEHAVAGQARTEALRAERGVLEVDLSDWRLLEQGLGRNGIQALEVDAAGPELTTMANDLLHTCLGPRFSVAIETTRRSADGKKQLEGCSVMVHDAKTGRVADAKTYSGGECVMIAEPVDLAIAMLGARRAGLEAPTLVRDERGAALSPENSRAYVAMLRRAAELTGARQVLFVSHNPDMNAAADARLNVADGRVWVT